jgi:hypothetical protein
MISRRGGSVGHVYMVYVCVRGRRLRCSVSHVYMVYECVRVLVINYVMMIVVMLLYVQHAYSCTCSCGDVL